MSEGGETIPNNSDSEAEKKVEHNFSDLSWSQLQNSYLDPNLGSEEKKKIDRARIEMIEDVLAFDETLAASFKWDLIEGAENSRWDRVYGTLVKLGINYENEFEGKEGFDSKWKGIYSDVAEAWASQAVISGVDEKIKSASEDFDLEIWLRQKHYFDRDLKRMASSRNRGVLAYESFGLPSQPAQLVETGVTNRLGENTNQTTQTIEQQQKMIDALLRQMAQNQMTPEMLREAMSQMSPEMLKDLYLKAERQMIRLPDAKIQLPGFLLKDATQTEVVEWQARIALVNACAGIREAPSFKELFPNDSAKEITNVQLETLVNGKPGVLEAKSLITKILKDDTVSERGGAPLPELLLGGDELDEMIEVLIDAGADPGIARARASMIIQHLTNSVYDIQEGRQREAFLDGISYWLVKNRGLNLPEAGDCATIAWNLSYAAGEPFYYDSYFFQTHRPGGEDQDGEKMPGRPSPTVPQFKALSMWMLMHPLERLDLKVSSSNNAWGIFGAWAYNKSRKNPEWTPYAADLLPKSLIPDTFTFTKDSTSTKDHRVTFSDIFYKNGDLLASNPLVPRGALQELDFSGLNEGVFASYLFLQIAPAITVFSVINKPHEFRDPWPVLSDAFRDLGVSNKYRENILKGTYGINPNKNQLTPKNGYNAYRAEVLRSDPNFFT